jgi:hypothetical protein
MDVSLLDSAGGSRSVGDLKDLSPGPDGLVTAVLDSAHLRAGRYAVALTSMRSDGTLPSDRFIIELR